MTFGLTLWELLCGKRAVIQTSDHDDVLDVCSGRVVVIDAANQAKFGQGRSVDALVKTVGQRVVAAVLANAQPAVIIDGEHAAPGAGKLGKADLRARAAGVNVPAEDSEARYRRGAEWFNRDALGDEFRRFRERVQHFCTAMGIYCHLCHAASSEAEAGGTWLTQSVTINGTPYPAASVALMGLDKDQLAYGCVRSVACLENTKKKGDFYYQFIELDDVLERLKLHGVSELRALNFWLGHNDRPPPVESCKALADTPWASATAATAAHTANNGTLGKIMGRRVLREWKFL